MEEGKARPHSKRGQAGEPSLIVPSHLLAGRGGLERIIADRIVRHLSRIGPDLSREQYGFRSGRSTIDAIIRVRSTSEAAAEEGGVLMAVSFDISNAFNTLLWWWIMGALNHHGVPPYLAAILGDYFRDKVLEYVDRDGAVQGREIECGVPQGSVLGPLLWNLAYDQVLRSALPPAAQSSTMQTTRLCSLGERTGAKRKRGQPWRQRVWCALSKPWG